MRSALGIYFICRYFGTGNVVFKKRSHESKVLHRMIEQSSKRDKFLTHTVSSSFVQAGSKGPNPHVLRRVTVLNKVYMDHVLQILNTCAVYAETVGDPVEISHVNITNDFKILNIYWFVELAKHSQIDIIERKLHVYAKELRHQLCQLRVIGRVPIVQFVKNKSVAAINEIEKLLAIADYGEDYERTSVFLNNENLVTYTAEKRNTEDKNQLDLENSKDTFSITLPAMRHDVLGLDHAKIMNRIQAVVNKKFEGKLKKLESSPQNPEAFSRFQSSLTFLTDKEQEVKFKRFLLERKKLRDFKQRELKQRIDTRHIFEEDNHYNDEFEDQTDDFK